MFSVPKREDEQAEREDNRAGKKTRIEAGFTGGEEKRMGITKDKDSRRGQDDSVLKA